MPYFYHCRAMVTLYSAEAYEEAKLALISRLLADIDTVESAAERAGEVLPVSGGWAELAIPSSGVRQEAAVQAAQGAPHGGNLAGGVGQ